MPEGHTIHRLARDIAKDLAGQLVRVTSPQGRVMTDRVDGSRFVGTEAHGKHLLLRFADATLHVHLGLFGRFRRYRVPHGPSRDTIRLRLETDACVWELSGATRSDWVTDEDAANLGGRVGPDPLSPTADPSRAWQAIHASRRTLGALLLDQSVIAGIGNVYRAEILHLMKLSPDMPGNALSRPTFGKLWRLTARLLQKGVDEKRIRTVPGAGARTGRRDSVHVYGRRTCFTCGGPVRRRTVAARTLYDCPACQPMPD